jgi:hypothetical protein
MSTSTVIPAAMYSGGAGNDVRVELVRGIALTVSRVSQGRAEAGVRSVRFLNRANLPADN